MPHPESPLRLSLVQQMMTDPIVQLVPRAIDARWRKQNLLDLSMAGFNPFQGSVFYARESQLAQWLKTPESSARKFNSGDRLIYDLLMAVHDYLHVWGTRLIQRLAPTIGFGTGRITRENLEDHVFCELVAEAVATIGLDYWYLCTFDLNAQLPIGTRFTAGLTVSYSEQNLPEFQRANPALRVQCKEFFVGLCRFYCSGEFLGFDANDIKESPLLEAWLSHELRYGELQRKNSRTWFCYLSDEDIRLSPRQEKAPVACQSAWQVRLIEDIADALWRKVKHNEVMVLPTDSAPAWRSPLGKAPDFRFRNANELSEDQRWNAALAASADHFNFIYGQCLSRHDCAAFDPVLVKLLPLIREKKDVARLRVLLSGQPLLEKLTEEPADLLLLN